MKFYINIIYLYMSMWRLVYNNVNVNTILRDGYKYVATRCSLVVAYKYVANTCVLFIIRLSSFFIIKNQTTLVENKIRKWCYCKFLQPSHPQMWYLVQKPHHSPLAEHTLLVPFLFVPHHLVLLLTQVPSFRPRLAFCQFVHAHPMLITFHVLISNIYFPPFYISCNIRKNNTIYSSLLICD